MNRLPEVHNQVAVCRKCSFTKYCKFPANVHGEFSSRIMVVGESAYEKSIDAGKYYAVNSLRSILDGVLDLDRECYMTDLVKCDKDYLEPGNSFKEAADCCNEYLAKEIDYLDPKVIIAVGSWAFSYLTGLSERFRERQGDGIDYFYRNIRVLPMIHPSYRNNHYGKTPWQEKIGYNSSVRNIFLQARAMEETTSQVFVDM